MEWRKLTPNDVKELGELCQTAIPSHYYVTEAALEQKLFQHRCFCKEASYSVWDDGECIGFVGVKIPDCEKLFSGMAWISILVVKKEEQRKGYGTLLLEKTQKTLKAMGIQKFIVGQDFSCLFSGLPEVTEELCGFFRKNGFVVSAECVYYDLEGNVQDNPLIEEFSVAQFESCWKADAYDGEENALLAFLECEFPGRWKHEVECALREGKSHEEIMLLWDKAQTEVLGFCMLSKEPDGRGKLGPIGIAEKIRGNGVGEFFLCKSLQQLKNLGRNRVNIDWTILTKFYGKFGFVPERTYCGAYKEL